jgi:catechol 2,3-dioxygenase-like lactoylglutathione lyase family enzyme
MRFPQEEVIKMKKLENPKELYPMIVTQKIRETKEFYLKAGFKIRHEMADQYVQVYYEPGEGLDLAFMAPHAAPNGRNYPEFAGEGLIISIPTPSADDKCEEFRKRGVHIENALEDKPWGWRSFHVADPNGVLLDFFHVYKAMPAMA